MAKEKEIEIMFNGQKYKVVLGKITYGQRNAILGKSVETVIEGGKMVAKVNYAKLERELVLASVRKVEPGVNDVGAFIDALDIDEAQKIIDVALELNPLRT